MGNSKISSRAFSTKLTFPKTHPFLQDSCQRHNRALLHHQLQTDWQEDRIPSQPAKCEKYLQLPNGLRLIFSRSISIEHWLCIHNARSVKCFRWAGPQCLSYPSIHNSSATVWQVWLRLTVSSSFQLGKCISGYRIYLHLRGQQAFSGGQHHGCLWNFAILIACEQNPGVNRCFSLSFQMCWVSAA